MTIEQAPAAPTAPAEPPADEVGPGPGLDTAPAPARDRPVAGPRRQHGGDAGVEARQVTRIIRRVEPWSVARVAFTFSLALWLILVVASVILWRVATAVGAVSHVESFLAQLLADQSFTIDGGQLLRAAAISGVVLVIAGTGFTVLLALLFNLISELTGGLRLSVIEVETARRPKP